jgi:hypothetical protein
VLSFAHPAASTQRRIVELRPGEQQTVDVTLDVPMPVPTDEYVTVAASASGSPASSVVPPPPGSGSNAVPGGRGSPFGVASSLASGAP